MPTSFKEVITQLLKQRAAIDKAVAALEQVGEEGADQAETSKSPAKKASKKSASKKAATKRALSPEARKRISDAVKRRWAAARKGAKKQAPATKKAS